MSSFKRKLEKSKKKAMTSSLDSHNREGKELIPPMMKIPNMNTVSWRDNRLPELLWADLLLVGLGRKKAIQVMKEIVHYLYTKEENQRPNDITHTALASLSSEALGEFVQKLCSDKVVCQALQPLLILCPELPGSNIWQMYLPKGSPIDMVNILAKSVFEAFDHQSQTATDCRWLRVFYWLVTGKLHDRKDFVEKIINYPYMGDMKKIRPQIRAIEMQLNVAVKPNLSWPKKFWRICMERTECSPVDLADSNTVLNSEVIESDVIELIEKLKMHWYQTVNDTDINPKRDTVFGVSFYCLSILEELARSDNSTGILGRSGIRSLVECYITLAYLTKKNQNDLWQAYRQYGTGQAKLSLLKLTEKVDIEISSISIKNLEMLANEDYWQEFLPINLGNWQKKNLRKLSEEAGVKDVYDAFYDWTSGYMHGHWGAVRDSVFRVCVNPLHRFHRVPDNCRKLNDVKADAVIIVNKVLDLLNGSYPSFLDRLPEPIEGGNNER